MQTKPVKFVRAALEHLNRCSSPDQPGIDDSDSWLAPDLLEMLMATVRIGLDGQEVVNLAVLSPELYGDKECFWSLDELRNDIRPQRRADD